VRKDALCLALESVLLSSLNPSLLPTHTVHTPPHTMQPYRELSPLRQIIVMCWSTVFPPGGYNSQDLASAISGLVKQLQQYRPGDRYLAGLWHDTFIQDMLWFRDVSEPLLDRPSHWTAPTRSWASTKTGVDSEFADASHGLVIWAQSMQASCVPVNEDGTRALSSAWMTIRGLVFKAISTYDHVNYDDNVKYDVSLTGVPGAVMKRTRTDIICRFFPDYLVEEEGKYCVQSDASLGNCFSYAGVV
jgi:hypothetical protein